MRSGACGAAGAVILSAACATHTALGACPPFPSPEPARESGVMASTFTGGLKRMPPPARHVPIPPGVFSSVKITFHRGSCLGSCPAYRVEIRGDGAVTFQGDADVLVLGKHSFRIPSETVQCLLDDFRVADFWSLRQNYVAPLTDSSLHQVTLQIDGRGKILNDYVGEAVGMPPIVRALETAIDAAAANRFVRGDDHTLATLQAERFNFKDEAGAAVLAHAAATGPDDLVLGLIAEGAPLRTQTSWKLPPPEKPAILSAAARGRAQVVRALIAAGALSEKGPNLKNDVYLAAAASLDDDTLVETLAVHPDINARDTDGKTALMPLEQDDQIAPDQLARNGLRQVAIAKRLLALGADSSLRNRSGGTALFYLAEPELVRLLVQAGTPLETRNDLGLTPLLSATTDAAALALLEAGADPNAADDDGDTVFKTATTNKWGRTLAFLSAREAKP